MRYFFIVLSLLSIKQKESKMWEKGGRGRKGERRGIVGKGGDVEGRDKKGC